MGLLDDMGPLLRGKPKQIPGMDFGLPDIAPGVGKSPMDFGIADLAKPPGADQQKSMDFALNDIAPSAQAPGPAMGPTGKIASQLGEGSKMLPQDVASAAPPPSPTAGLLAANVPLPPSRPAGLGGMPPTRSAAAVPLPVPRPAGLGGTEVASAAPPTPPPVAPSAPIAPPPAPPPVATAASGGGLGGAAGAGGLAGLAGPLSKMAGAMQGKPGPPPPEAKAPQIAPSNIGAEVSQTQAAGKAQAPQILQGLLAPAQNNTLDPRKRQRMA